MDGYSYGKAMGDALFELIVITAFVALVVGGGIGIGVTKFWNSRTQKREQCAAMYQTAKTERDTLNTVRRGCALPTTPTRGTDE